LGAIHTSNFYPNFTPEQELCDWFQHWATAGVKPVFMCEYGAPFSWDWAMYRGWYKGRREFGSAVVPWEFCLAEWNAQFFGDRAFLISEMEKRNLRWEAAQFKAGKLWYRWDYPHQLGSPDFPERDPVFALYYSNNWRAYRTWGVSGTSPWEHHILHRLRPGVPRNQRVELSVDWDNIQRPGFSPDFLQDRYERMDTAYGRGDWVPTVAAEALARNNKPLLAWIAGKPSAFTSKDHVFVPGEHFEKQIIVINDSRRTVACTCTWVLSFPNPVSGTTNVSVQTGKQVRIPLRLEIPEQTEPGAYPLELEARFDTGEVQHDCFMLHVLPRATGAAATEKVALFDPKGETARLLERLGVQFMTVGPDANLRSTDMLIIGKHALTVDGRAPDLSAVRTGLRVLVFEQTTDVLEKRLGFRVAEYGFRKMFARVPDHPALCGLRPEHLENWRGEATLLPAKRNYKMSAKYNNVPAVEWCGLEVPRIWRCGCRGNVASVAVEKPACGDFTPIVDGGFSLQYTPLFEYREGTGLVVFCQLDVTGRTEPDPAADTVAANLVRYVRSWKPGDRRRVYYVGCQEGESHLTSAGFNPHRFPARENERGLLIIGGPVTESQLGNIQPRVKQWIGEGNHVLAIGITPRLVEVLFPFGVVLENEEHINAWFEPPAFGSSFCGVAPADVHCRDPRKLFLVKGGAKPVGNGVIGLANDNKVVICQLVPWEFDYRNNYGLKRTFRRASFLLTRLACNLGAECPTPILSRISTPVSNGEKGRWLQGLYLDQPEEWDDPYRFFRW
ncbi:MAG: hypothetical protein N3G20_12230, partial [Verrucomicrobiae bacterium]|nr:hypothetical protein [Verrucomicrobiae bacterium]